MNPKRICAPLLQTCDRPDANPGLRPVKCGFTTPSTGDEPLLQTCNTQSTNQLPVINNSYTRLRTVIHTLYIRKFIHCTHPTCATSIHKPKQNRAYVNGEGLCTIARECSPLGIHEVVCLWGSWPAKYGNGVTLVAVPCICEV